MKYKRGDEVIVNCLFDPVLRIRGAYGEIRGARLDCNLDPLYEVGLLHMGAWDVVHVREHELSPYVGDWLDWRLD